MSKSNKHIKVVFFQRKPLPIHKSIESIFDDVRSRMPPYIECVKVVFRFYSQGLLNRLQILKEAFKNQGDVNHITGDIHFSAILLKKRKTMLTIHDCRLLFDTHGLKHFIFKFFWFTLPLRSCTLVTVVSQSTKEQLLRFIDYPEAKILVIPDAISSAFCYNEKEFNNDTPVILQVGTTINKNIDRLIDAIEGIGCQIRFIGLLTPAQHDILKERNIDYINLFDISLQELVQQYNQSDIISFVSTFEGFGMPILEANTVGRPVITSNILSMPEVAGNAACMVDPLNVLEIREGILRIINDETYRNLLVKNGLENCKRFDAQKIADCYLECYQALSGKF